MTAKNESRKRDLNGFFFIPYCKSVCFWLCDSGLDESQVKLFCLWLREGCLLLGPLSGPSCYSLALLFVSINNALKVQEHVKL